MIGFTSTAAAVFGVYFKLQSFIFMPVFGLNNGMVPIIGFNYGARKPDRLMKTMRLAVTYAVSIMIIGMILFWAFTKQLLGIFNASEQMLAIGIPALRIISLSFLLAGFDIIIISVMQALGHGVISLIISMMRQLVPPSSFLKSGAWVLCGLPSLWQNVFPSVLPFCSGGRYTVMRFSLYITQSVKSKLQKALCFRIGLFYMLLIST